MHLWRGLQVADGGVLSADLNVGFLDDGLKVGLWGGTDFTGDYKEFDYYASYTVAGFTVAVWDIYNYSPDLPYSKDIFNYNKYSTSHFLDLSVAYNFDTLLKVPLRVSWATDLCGPRPESGGQQPLFDLPLCRVQRLPRRALDGGCRSGRHVCLQPRRGGRRCELLWLRRVNQISLKTTYKLRIKRFEMPLFAHAMWNPDQRQGYLQVGVNLFAF